MKSLLHGIMLLVVTLLTIQACGNLKEQEIIKALEARRRGAESDQWYALSKKAYEAATKEFCNEFVVDAPGWEAGKGAIYFVANLTGLYMKYDADGRLVKTGEMKDFPELTRFFKRQEELLRQYREEYAQSIGMTVEEVKLSLGRSRHPGISKKKSNERRAEIQPKIEKLIGYKFGQVPIENVSVKTNKCSRWIELQQDLKLKNPYRYLRDITLTYRNDKLVKANMYVCFGDEFSEESIQKEFEELFEDVAKRLGGRIGEDGLSSRTYSSRSYRYGGFKIKTQLNNRTLGLEISDDDMCEEIDAAFRKRGRDLPKLDFSAAIYSKDVGHRKVQLWKDGPYWAETNIGAEEPWQSGYVFWWGDTIGYKRVGDVWVASDGSSSNFVFDSKHIPTFGKNESDLRQIGWITTDSTLAPEHDAAHVHWGGEWRMPTDQELKDICDKCDWKWKTLNGVDGYLICGRGDYALANIFLPCIRLDNVTALNYWSSVPYSSNSNDAWNLNINAVRHWMVLGHRFYGFVVRPIQSVAK